MRMTSKFNIGTLLRESAAEGHRMGTITIRVVSTRRMRVRLWIAARFIRLASWIAYGLVEVVETGETDA